MDNSKLIKKLKDVLLNNKQLQQEIKNHNETAKRLTHWEVLDLKEYVNSIVSVWSSGEVVLSNEGTIELTDAYYTTEFLFGLDSDFKTAGLFVEAYDAGTFHVYLEDY